MRLSKLFVSAIIVCSILLWSCNSTDQDVTPGKIVFGQDIAFSSSLYFRNQPSSYNDEESSERIKTTLQTTGVSDSRHFYRFSLEMSHVATRQEQGKSVRISEGTFLLSGTDQQSIYGTYQGYGDLTHDPEDMAIFLIINGGTGDFEGASGYLNGIGSLKDGQPNVRKLVLDGTITTRSRSQDNITS